MIKPKYLKQQIANHLEKYLKLPDKVMLNEWEFEIISISNGEVILADADTTVGKVVFSMIADIEKVDNTSKVTTVSPCRLVGVADVSEYPSGVDENGEPIFLPEISIIQISAIEEKSN